MEWTPESIRKLRSDLGYLSRKAFSKKVGVAAITVFRWEKGETSPEPPMLKNLDELACKAGLYPCGLNSDTRENCDLDECRFKFEKISLDLPNDE